MNRIVGYLLGLVGVSLVVLFVSLSGLSFYLRSQVAPATPSAVTKRLTWVPDAGMLSGERTFTIVADEGQGGTTTKDITITLLAASPSPSPTSSPSPRPTLSPTPTPTTSPSPFPSLTPTPTTTPSPSVEPSPELSQASVVVGSERYTAEPGETVDIPITVTARGHNLTALLERAFLIIFDPSPALRAFNPIFLK